MKNILRAFFAFALALSACADDDSDIFLVRGGERASDDSSSSTDVLNSSSSRSQSSSSVDYVLPEEYHEVYPACNTDGEDECEYGQIVDKRDGHIYRTVEIGSQVWMAENLAYRPNGKAVYDSKLKCLERTSGECVDYGPLYTWGEAIDSAKVYETLGIECGYRSNCELPLPVRGICPEGWHLPSYDEWDVLSYAMDLDYRAMQATGFSLWSNATDLYGFSALPAGYISGDGSYSNLGYALGFWASTGGNRARADSWYVHSNEFGHTDDEKKLGYSVRCVQD